MIFPTPRAFGKMGYGPCRSSEVLRAGAAAVGVTFELDAEQRVVVDGITVATLAEADEHIEARAIRQGHLIALRAAKEAEEARLVICQREARIAIQETRDAQRRAGIRLPPELL